MPIPDFTTVIATADVPNKNGHVYTYKALQHVIDSIGDRPIFGTLNMPEGETSVDLANASHAVSNLRIDEHGDFVGTVRVLGTPKGLILETLLACDVQLDFRTSGVGNIVERDGVKVIENFHILSINAVSDGA